MTVRAILLASALALAATPTLSAAQTRCEQQAHDKKVTGTILGGVVGALAGNALGRGGGRTGGTIIGGVAGAAIGNNLARTHCPPGYDEVQDQAYVPPPTYQTYDRDTFWRSAPQGLRERMDWMQARIDRARADGDISPRQERYAENELRDIRRMSESLRDRDGGRLTPEDRDYLQSRLDTLGRNLRWMRDQ